VATETAIALGADKLLFLMERAGVEDGTGVVNQLSPASAERWLAEHTEVNEETARHLRSAASAVRRGVRRVHLIARSDGALLAELYTRDGTGTMVTAETYEGLRAARFDDIPGILELIEPLEAAGALVRRSREQLELEAERFVVIERDGAVIGCAALYPRQGLERLFVLSTQTMHWFRERGYEPAPVDSLPGERRGLYNWQRNSKVFSKTL